MDAEKDTKSLEERESNPDLSLPSVGQDHLYDALPPHPSYEGSHRYDVAATWTAEEEAVVVRKTDMYLLSWICLMVENLNPVSAHYGFELTECSVLRTATGSRQSLQRRDGQLAS